MPDTFAMVKHFGDGRGVVAFLPAVSGNVAATFAVSAGIHHHHGVTVAQQELGVPQDSRAIVRHAMEEQDPIAIGFGRANFPSAQSDTVWCANSEILLGRACPGEHLSGVFQAIRVQPHGMKDAGADGIPHKRCDGRNQQQHDNGGKCESAHVHLY